jgi:hypothetical protein
MSGFKNACLKLLRWLVVNPVAHFVASVLAGAGDAIFHAIYVVTGLAKHPHFFFSWQSINSCFQPPFELPLDEGSQYLKKARSIMDPFGNYTAAVVFRYIPFNDADRALDALRKVNSTVSLDPTLVDGQGRYPVCYCFGFHERVMSGWMLWWNRLKLPLHFGGIDYSEVCIGVLGVRLPSADHVYPGPFLYMPRLHLNRWWPYVMGKSIGLDKVVCRVAPSDSNYEVRPSGKGEPLYRASFEPYGNIAGTDDFSKFTTFRNLLDLPLLTGMLGDILYVYFDWGWDHAYVQPIRGSMECLVDGIPAMPKGRFEFTGIDQDVSGALRLHIPWELVAPFRRNELVKELLDARTAARQPTPSAAAQAAAFGGTLQTGSQARQ